MIILIYAMPGSGKTVLSKKLISYSNENYDGDCDIFHADEIRSKLNRGDQSLEGKIKFAKILRELAENSNKSHQIIDFVAPTKETREVIDADLSIWVHTTDTSNYNRTNKIFNTEKFGNVYEFKNYDDNHMCDIWKLVQGWR